METVQGWEKFDTFIKAGVDRILLYGPPGTGKTVAAMGASQHEAGYRFTCTGDATVFDVVGGQIMEGGNSKFVMAPPLQAYTSGGTLVVDEFDKLSDAGMGEMLNLCDSADSQQYRHPFENKIFERGVGFRVIITTNLESFEMIPDALLDRFPCRVHITTPHPNGLATLPANWRGYAAQMASGPRRMSLRMFQELARLSNRLGEEQAAYMLLGDQAGPFLEAIRMDRFTTTN